MAIQSLVGGMLMTITVLSASPEMTSTAADRLAVSSMDLEYQAAVKRNDVPTMGRILHEEFVLVRGDGRTVTREQILSGARSGDYVYEQQDEIEGTQVVRVWGDTAVVTALLWVKGKYRDEEFDRRVWFSDTYVRTPAGWRYAFAQVSLPVEDGLKAR